MPFSNNPENINYMLIMHFCKLKNWIILAEIFFSAKQVSNIGTSDDSRCEKSQSSPSVLVARASRELRHRPHGGLSMIQAQSHSV